MSNLRDVEAAKEAFDKAEAHLKATIRDAHEGGVPISKLASAVGVARPTIYAWLEPQTDPN